MMRFNRAAAIAATAILAGTPALSANVEFQTWTFTEETGRGAIEALAESFEAGSGLTVEPQGYA